MRLSQKLFTISGAMGSIYKILITGCLIYELVMYRVRKQKERRLRSGPI